MGTALSPGNNLHLSFVNIDFFREADTGIQSKVCYGTWYFCCSINNLQLLQYLYGIAVCWHLLCLAPFKPKLELAFKRAYKTCIYNFGRYYLWGTGRGSIITSGSIISYIQFIKIRFRYVGVDKILSWIILRILYRTEFRNSGADDIK